MRSTRAGFIKAALVGPILAVLLIAFDEHRWIPVAGLFGVGTASLAWRHVRGSR